MAKPVVPRGRCGTAAALSRVADDTTEQPRREAGEFREIVISHEQYLRRVALRLSGDRDKAQDLVQETFARAWLHFGELTQGTNARAWLATILTRLFLDEYKHEKVITKAGQELVTLEVVWCDLDMTISSVPDTMLWDAVEVLDPDLREVIELRYLHEFSYKEIADRLQLPVGTVGTRLMRAHERLKDLLRQRTS